MGIFFLLKTEIFIFYVDEKHSNKKKPGVGGADFLEDVDLGDTVVVEGQVETVVVEVVEDWSEAVEVDCVATRCPLQKVFRRFFVLKKVNFMMTCIII